MTVQKHLSKLDQTGCKYAFYTRRADGSPIFAANQERFPSASIIKVPILLAWVHLERAGLVKRDEECALDAEPQVQGAGLAWQLRARRLPYQDVLLLMIALSDNLCTNLVIRRAGLARLNEVFREALGLHDTELQRKLMDYEARARGLDNWVSARDCVRLFACIDELRPEERAWVESLLAANQDDLLLLRDIPRDTLTFYHKTGNIPQVLHDWGYTRDCQIFLLTENVQDETAVFPVFGALGRQALFP